MPGRVPPGVVRQVIRFEPGGRVGEAARAEWFITGTEMDVVRLADAAALAHIAYPGQGTIIALDPDIPPQNQRIALQLSGAPGPGWQWRVDGRTVGRATEELLWRPSPGRHRLALIDADGRELETVSFEVRALKSLRTK